MYIVHGYSLSKRRRGYTLAEWNATCMNNQPRQKVSVLSMRIDTVVPLPEPQDATFELESLLNDQCQCGHVRGEHFTSSTGRTYRCLTQDCGCVSFRQETAAEVVGADATYSSKISDPAPGCYAVKATEPGESSSASSTAL